MGWAQVVSVENKILLRFYRFAGRDGLHILWGRALIRGGCAPMQGQAGDPLLTQQLKQGDLFLSRNFPSPAFDPF